MAAASLVISILAFVVSAAALAWQIANYLLTGQRATVSVSGMSLLAVPDGAAMEPVAQIIVRAVGRVPVEVTGWSVSYPDDQHLIAALVALQYGHLPGVHLGDTLPMVIDPGRSGHFSIPIVAIVSARDKLNLDPHKGHVSVQFAARRTIKLRKPVGKLVRLPRSSGSAK